MAICLGPCPTSGSPSAPANRRALIAPVVVFAFLLNFPWEFLQVPLFAGMAQMPHWQAVKMCTRAALGDVVIMLLSFWLVSAVRKSRHWVFAPSPREFVLLVCTGVLTTVGIELAVLQGSWVASWHYAPEMPLVPVLGVGLAPVLQWVVLPPLVVWFVGSRSA